MRKVWCQSSIAQWRWLPRYSVISGAVFIDEKKYRPSYANWHWGRWILAWEVRLYPPDSLPEGAETVVNTYPCVVEHWDWTPIFSRRKARSR
jgi:hypothetical protein